LSGTLTARVLCETFETGVLKLAAGAPLSGLKGPASSFWKKGLLKPLTGLGLKFVCERLLFTKTISGP